MSRIFNIFLSGIVFTLSAFVLFTTIEKTVKRAHEEGETERTGAKEALDFWTASRAYPDNDIPRDKFFRAYELSKLKTKEISRAISSGSIWDPIGPLNLQGRSNSIAINPLNPNTVYVGTASGGLWVSRMGGLGGDWTQVKLGYPALGISAIVINPADTNIIYIGTGEVYKYLTAAGGVVQRTTRGSYGIGILKTTDGGTTWTKCLNWTYNQQRGIQAIIMNPLNPNTLWAATTEGILKTANAGTSWEVNFPAPMTMDIVSHLTDTNKLLASVGNFSSSMVLQTTDGGNNWNVTALPSYTGKTILEVYQAHPNVVYASAADSTTGVGALYRSTDFGTSWTKLKEYLGSGVYGVQGWYSHFVAVHPTDSNQVIHAGVPAYKSIDGGRTFFGSTGSYSDHHGHAHHPTNPNILYVVNDDGVYRSTDFGSSFSNVGYGMQSGQIYNGFSCSASDSLIALAQSQDHIPGYRYLGSMVWDHNSASDESGWTGINQQNDNIMYAGDRYGGNIYKSANRGASFFYSGGFDGGNEGLASWNSPFNVSFSNPNIIYFGTRKIYKSINAGGSWSVTNGGSNLDGNPSLCMAVAPTNSDTVFVGTAPIASRAKIFRTANGGTSWTNVTGTLPDRYPMDLAVDPVNSQIAYAAFGGFGTGHLYKSIDAGTNWTNMTGTLPDVPTTAIIIDPLNANNVYVGNDIGVYVSTDGGSTWATFSAGMPDGAIISDLQISPSNSTLRAATHGNGVWERKLLYALPPDYFDYKAATLVSPVDGGEYNAGTSLSPLRASFRNISAIVRPDWFDVKYRILFGGTEIYSQTKHIAPLAAAETRTVSFDGTFAPAIEGTYTIQAISLASDNNAKDDTLHGTITIYPAPTASGWKMTKFHASYVEISSGTPGPAGDDFQSRIQLPFSFKFDNYTYDSAQISTNGWMEFGTGASGSVRGLTDASLLQYFTQTLGLRSKPTKALGPWWTDLSANGSNQTITYTALGTAPDRIFVVQWKNIPANYDPSTGVFINFQIKLYETTNIIEFCYGPMLAGYMPPGAAGASMGLKDYLGGDYRYFDLTRNGTGLSGDLNSNLSPLTDWHGPDTTYSIGTNFEGATVNVDSGWGLVSLPVTRTNRHVYSTFTSAINGTAFGFSTSYVQVDSLQYGKGFWIKTIGASNQPIAGSPLANVAVTLIAGWNLIGSADHEVSAPSGGIVTSSVYGYSTAGYTPATTLIPGKGYWVKTGSAGVINLGPQAVPRLTSETPVENCTITIRDRFNRQQTLALAEISSRGINLDRYELPPLPPGELFDARFASQRMLETYPQDLKSAVYPIQMQSPVYPMTISYKISNSGNNSFIIEQLSNDKVVSSNVLSGEGKITIANGDELSLRLRVTGGKEIPKQFALSQNYPNPFNPATTITFDLPVKSSVSLIVYDILGKEVMRLAAGEYEAGTHKVQADFSNLASGIYLYRLDAGSFNDVKKMLLLK